MEKIAVIGLGFVGLPLSLTYALHGVKVVGIDINKDYIERLKKGQTHVYEEYNGKHIETILKESLENGLFEPTDSYEEGLRDVKEIIVTVGIPIENDKVNMSVFENAMKSIGKNLKKDSIVLIRSTVPPLTTKNIAKPLIEETSGLKEGKDFYLAYSSERIAEGRAFEEFQTMPVAVSGLSIEGTKRAKRLLELINPNVIEASSPEVVEISKLIENASRDVNIAIVNELANLTKALGVDTMEVIKVANTHKRVKLLTPGIGVGGHCIPFASKYIFYLSDKIGLEMPLLHAARSVNDRRPKDIAEIIENALQKVGKNINNSKIGFLGIAMKDNSSDISESPAIMLKEILKAKGAQVSFFDPKVKGNFDDDERHFEALLSAKDVIVIPIIHNEISYDIDTWKSLLMKDAIIFDAKGVFNKEKVTNLGFHYYTI
ncbi:nucleotide sugar dehydrogenase [Caldisericum exile]|uniref:UDP-glucose/GDP-mannose dehydrogenase n=1 Tax=Caldisericum exile (strain DSM 21853 / NBRC 104410 / AZM16c01) TaxID=511051 RepID=A0A7U6JEW7_CALEA|nr:nucleotide sugar dehydrogenase [Caldisericum exile]BAL80883.1 UDP-glucose/GDP-mannose dehydrogenase [Caldisericum exile AZM16c01]